MTPPLVCPNSEPSHQADCPLYTQRVAYAPDETLRRLILTQRSASPDLAALIRGEQGEPAVQQGALPPGPPAPLPSILDQLKEEANVQSARPTT
jgi:hypothetical protein